MNNHMYANDMTPAMVDAISLAHVVDAITLLSYCCVALTLTYVVNVVVDAVVDLRDTNDDADEYDDDTLALARTTKRHNDMIAQRDANDGHVS